MNPREKAKKILEPHLQREEADKVVDQLVEAVKQEVVAEVLAWLKHEFPKSSKSAEDQVQPDISALEQKFSATWKQRFTRDKMTEKEFVKSFGDKNSSRLSNDLLAMVLKGADIG